MNQIMIYRGFHKWGTPKMDGLYGNSYTKVDDLGVPPF